MSFEEAALKMRQKEAQIIKDNPTLNLSFSNLFNTDNCYNYAFEVYHNKSVLAKIHIRVQY